MCVADNVGMCCIPGGFDTKTWYSKDPAKDAVYYTDWPMVNPTGTTVA
jgi:hypothetical protein